MMMTNASAATLPAVALAADMPVDSAEIAAPSRWATLGEDMQFFLVCYLAGLVVFLVMLS